MFILPLFLKINEIILVLRNPRGGLLFGRQGHIKAHYSDYLLLNSKFSKIQRLQPTLLCYQFMGQKLGQGTAEINCLCSTMSWESTEKTQTARESSGCLFTHLSGTCVCMLSHSVVSSDFMDCSLPAIFLKLLFLVVLFAFQALVFQAPGLLAILLVCFLNVFGSTELH